MQVKLTPYLGQDRQRNEFWCLQVGSTLSGKHPVVLCQEYSWVRLPTALPLTFHYKSECTAEACKQEHSGTT